MPLLSLKDIRHARVSQNPYPWGSVVRSFSSLAVARELKDTFPSGVYQHFVRSEGVKRHDLRGKGLHGKFGADEALSNRWQALVEELLGPAYREALQGATGVSLDGLSIALTVWRQCAGGFIDPHTDNPGKVLAHLFYFNDEDWSSADGGCFRILRSNCIDDVEAELPPHLGTSLFFVRSERSWHGYLPVRPGRERLALQVIFHRPDMEYSGG